MQPTDTLTSLLLDAETPLVNLQNAIAAVADNDSVPKGVLRIGAPVATGDLFLNALVGEFALKYPEVTVDLRYDDAVVDPVRDSFDLVVRSHALLLADHHAVPIGPAVDLSLVASPAYLDRAGVPKGVKDIANHDGVCFRLQSDDRLAPWVFATSGPHATQTARPRVRATVDNLPAVIEIAQAGLGLAMVYTHAVQSALASETLIEVLPGLPVAQPKFSLAYLSKRHMPAKVRRFVDFVKQ